MSFFRGQCYDGAGKDVVYLYMIPGSMAGCVKGVGPRIE